uniref:Uncharacterized protein n=1 Tax=Homalodisca liturata TaxID=320908 RepID=A0A1B6JCK0_9HEMI
MDTMSLVIFLVLMSMFNLVKCNQDSSFWSKIKKLINKINPLSIDTRPAPVINLDYLRTSLKNIEELIYDSSTYVQLKTQKMSSKILTEIKEELANLQFTSDKLEAQFNMTTDQIKRYQDSCNKLYLRLQQAEEMLQQTSPSVPFH